MQVQVIFPVFLMAMRFLQRREFTIVSPSEFFAFGEMKF